MGRKRVVPDDDWLTVRQAGQILGVSNWVVRWLIHQNRLPALKPEGRWYLSAIAVRCMARAGRGRKRPERKRSGIEQAGPNLQPS